MVLVYTISVVDNEGHYIRFVLYLMFMTSNYSESRKRIYESMSMEILKVHLFVQTNIQRTISKDISKVHFQ